PLGREWFDRGAPAGGSCRGHGLPVGSSRAGEALGPGGSRELRAHEYHLAECHPEIAVMKLNWFSPLPPAKTDIAHYTARILPALRAHAEVTLWTDQKDWDESLNLNAKVRRYRR